MVSIDTPLELVLYLAVWAMATTATGFLFHLGWSII